MYCKDCGKEVKKFSLEYAIGAAKKLQSANNPRAVEYLISQMEQWHEKELNKIGIDIEKNYNNYMKKLDSALKWMEKYYRTH